MPELQKQVHSLIARLCREDPEAGYGAIKRRVCESLQIALEGFDERFPKARRVMNRTRPNRLSRRRR